MYVPLFALSLADPQGVDIIVRMTKITSHLNDDVVFLQIINSVLMAYPPIGPLWMHSIRLLFVGSQKNRTLMINIFISFSFNFFSSFQCFQLNLLNWHWIDGESNCEPGLFICLHFRAKVGNTDFIALEPCFYLCFMKIMGTGARNFIVFFFCDKWSEFPAISF